MEGALADALAAAAMDRRWDVVARLARELEARRLAADPRVVSIGTARAAGRSDRR